MHVLTHVYPRATGNEKSVHACSLDTYFITQACQATLSLGRFMCVCALPQDLMKSTVEERLSLSPLLHVQRANKVTTESTI